MALTDFSNNPNYQTYSGAAMAAAQLYSVPQNLLLWQLGQESGWNPNAANAGHLGLGQFDASTAAQYGVNVNDPISSIYGTAKYDADLFSRVGDWGKVLNKYGTVGSSSPDSVVAQANEVLSSIGSNPLTAGTAGTGGPLATVGSGGILGSITDGVKAGITNAVEGFTGGFDFGRVAAVLLGLILIAGAIALFKPVRDTVVSVVEKVQTAQGAAALAA